MVLDPAPERYADSAAQPSVGVTKSATPSQTPSQAALVTESAGGHAVAPKSAIPDRHAGSGRRWLLIPLGVLLATLATVLTLLGRQRVRLFRRQRARDARSRVIGAWQETLDLLADCGLGELRAMTGAEVCQATDARFGVVSAQHVGAVAAAADQAAFSERIPVEQAHADDAWAAHRAARRTVRRSLAPTDRALSHLRLGAGRKSRRGPARAARLLPRRWETVASRRKTVGRRRAH